MTGMKAALSKVPEVTLGFWIIKIFATTLGETGGDAVTMSLACTPTKMLTTADIWSARASSWPFSSRP